MAAPLPVIFAARITIGRRLALMALLCSGILVAIAAVLRGYYSIKDISTVPVAAGWTARELCVAALVASAPGIKPLFSTSSWFAGSSHQNGNSGGSKSGQGAWNNELVTIGGTGAEPRHRLNNNDDDELAAPGFETGNKGQSQWHIRTKEADSRSDGSSEELILNDRTSGVNPQGAIHVTQKFQVTSNKL